MTEHDPLDETMATPDTSLDVALAHALRGAVPAPGANRGHERLEYLAGENAANATAILESKGRNDAGWQVGVPADPNPPPVARALGAS